MQIRKLAIVAASLVLGAGAAHAQAVSTGPGNPVLVGSVGAPELKGPDDTAANIDKAVRDEARNRGASARSSRAVPARREDIAVGAEIRDSKGVVIGTVDSLTLSGAVVAAAAGKVEVPYDAFGKNNKGLLIGVTKADFDKMVADANKPAG